MKREREELQRQKEALQKQIDFYKANSGVSPVTSESINRSPSLSPHTTPHGSTANLDSTARDNNHNNNISHRRSQSAELIDNPELLLDTRYSGSLTEPLNMREVRAQQLALEEQNRRSLSGSTSNISQLEKSSGIPVKSKSNNNNSVQQIPSKLVSKSSSPSTKQPKNLLPLNLAESKKVSSKDVKTPQKKNSDEFYF